MKASQYFGNNLLRLEHLISVYNNFSITRKGKRVETVIVITEAHPELEMGNYLIQ